MYSGIVEKWEGLDNGVSNLLFGVRACNYLPQPNPYTAWLLGVAEDCCMLSLLLAVASCIYSFWHGVIPTSYFRFLYLLYIFSYRTRVVKRATHSSTSVPSDRKVNIPLSGVCKHSFSPLSSQYITIRRRYQGNALQQLLITNICTIPTAYH